jgi:arylsulfatase A-like enzyme
MPNKLSTVNSQSARLNRFINANNQTPVSPRPVRPNIPVISTLLDKIDINSELNTILIVCDQHIDYSLLPNEILDKMPGYQAFKKLSIHYTNMYNNRVVCTPSRAVIQTGMLNTHIQDNIQDTFQYEIVPCLPTEFMTIGKIFRENDYFTRYLGKFHIDSKMYSTINANPFYGAASSGCLNVYGYDKFNVNIGDTDFGQHGYLADSLILNLNHSPTQSNGEYDHYDPINDVKSSGIIPFLKARKLDGKKFFMNINFVNPHDIMESRTDISQVPSNASMQFYRPFNNEQVDEYNTLNPDSQIKNPYYFNEGYRDAYIKNVNMSTNFFEKNYTDYKTNTDTLLNKNSLFNNFCLNPKYNHITPFYVGYQQYLKGLATLPDTPYDIKSWKNLINNYYGLIIEVDAYIYRIYMELERLNLLRNTNVIITADHGEVLASHGLREKGVPFNSNVNIPLIIYSPLLDNNSRNTTSNYICSSVDLIPTIMKLHSFTNHNAQFNGESVVKLNLKNNFDAKTRSENIKNGALHIQNATEALLTYFTYINWFLNISTTEQKDRLENNDIQFFDYRYAFVMYQTIYNSKHYKFGISYSLKDIIEYNIFHYNIPISIINIIENLPSQSITANNHLIALLTAGNYAQINSSVFLQIYDSLIPDILGLFIFMYSISKIVDKYVDRLYYIPGCFNNFAENKQKYNTFCYNITDDPDEIYNMLDDYNYSSDNDITFEYLNNELISNIRLQKIHPLFVIIPYDQIITQIIEILQEVILKVQHSEYDPENLISMDQINYLYIHTKLLTMVTNGDFNALMW